MPSKRWTIVIIPPENGATRTFSVSSRARHFAIGTATSVALLIVTAFCILFTPYATPGARRLATENERLTGELAQIDKQIKSLSDTLAIITQRDLQIRVFAGMPIDSSSANSANATIADATIEATPLAESALLPATGADRVLASIGSKLSYFTGGKELPKPFLGRLGFGRRPEIDGMIARATALSASFRAVSDTLTLNFERLANTPSILPTPGWLSSHYTQSRFHPILHESRAHEGIDVSAPMGSPIVAPASGIVKSVGREAGYGNTFEIDHGNGIVTRFAHCSRIVVREGARVTRGQVVATVGNTGLSTGPHLHYEVHVNGKPVDPLKYILPDKVVE
jgi:murein DD-endopeptidase MepM/ murein hydrolase activator NlpD